MAEREQNYKQQFVRIWLIFLLLYFIIWGFASGIESHEANYFKAQNALFVVTTIVLLLLFTMRKYSRTAFSNLRNFKKFDVPFAFDFLIVASYVVALIGLFSIDFKSLGEFRIGTVVVLSLLNILNFVFNRKM